LLRQVCSSQVQGWLLISSMVVSNPCLKLI
jgi:hypothetical protein